MCTLNAYVEVRKTPSTDREAAAVAQAQLRIYDIKPGLMAEWLELFQHKVVPLHEQHGLPVRGAWVDDEHSQFAWVREFVGAGTIEEQEKAYRASPERTRVIGDEPARFIERMEVRTVVPALLEA